MRFILYIIYLYFIWEAVLVKNDEVQYEFSCTIRRIRSHKDQMKLTTTFAVDLQQHRVISKMKYRPMDGQPY
jgi:hypothetical protein